MPSLRASPFPILIGMVSVIHEICEHHGDEDPKDSSFIDQIGSASARNDSPRNRGAPFATECAAVQACSLTAQRVASRGLLSSPSPLGPESRREDICPG